MKQLWNGDLLNQLYWKPLLPLPLTLDEKKKFTKNMNARNNLVTVIISIILSACVTTDIKNTYLHNTEIVNYGLYELETLKRINIQSSPTGKMSIINIKNHKQTTINVPAAIGTRFGVEYIVRSEKSDRIKLNIKWIPDVPVKRKDGSLSKDTSYFITKKTNYVQYAGYGFRIESELEPKSWKLQIFSQSDLLFEKIFYVTKVK